MLDFVKHLAKLENEPQWLKDKRTVAWEKFSQLPMPSEAEEAWRLLDLTSIDLDKLTSETQLTSKGNDLKELDVSAGAGFDRDGNEHLYWYRQIKQFIKDAAGILIVSPQGIWSHLDQEIAHQGVIFMTMAEAIEKHADIVRPYLERSFAGEQTEKEGKFTLLNQSLCSVGMVIYVPVGVVINKPLVCLNLFDHPASSLMASRLLLIAEKQSQLSVVNVLVSDKLTGDKEASQHNEADKQFSLLNYLLQVYLQAGAQLDYAEVQNFALNTFAIDHSDYILERDTRLNCLIAALGAGQLKGEIRTTLNDRGAESTLNGVILGNQSERFNFNTIENHDAPDTKSSIDVRVALKDEAQSIYQGTIKVAKAAQKTDAFQSNKNLLLGEKAHADSIPKLEILADDVKCSHGATIGPADRNQIFYLMSRGLSANKAEELIVNGFFHQIVAACTIEGVSDWLDSFVANKIAEGTIYGETKINLGLDKILPVGQANVKDRKTQPALSTLR